ncbi:MAG: von Willebrand factor type A domain-containing protein [Verrucomicrobia bacterium]|nr:von Willebrand factor type A domain-containing protein [Verrucomicrobiota bacterium]
MNSNFPRNPQEHAEARLTALLLGELPPDEADELRRAIAGDAELAKLHERLKQTIGLVRETMRTAAESAEVTSAQPKLSAKRREELLRRFKILSPKELSPVRRSKIAWPAVARLAAALVGLLALVGFILEVGLTKHRERMEMAQAPVSLTRYYAGTPSNGRQDLKEQVFGLGQLGVPSTPSRPETAEAQNKAYAFTTPRTAPDASRNNVYLPAQPAPAETPPAPTATPSGPFPRTLQPAGGDLVGGSGSIGGGGGFGGGLGGGGLGGGGFGGAPAIPADSSASVRFGRGGVSRREAAGPGGSPRKEATANGVRTATVNDDLFRKSDPNATLPPRSPFELKGVSPQPGTVDKDLDAAAVRTITANLQPIADAGTKENLAAKSNLGRSIETSKPSGPAAGLPDEANKTVELLRAGDRSVALEQLGEKAGSVMSEARSGIVAASPPPPPASGQAQWGFKASSKAAEEREGSAPALGDTPRLGSYFRSAGSEPARAGGDGKMGFQGGSPPSFGKPETALRDTPVVSQTVGDAELAVRTPPPPSQVQVTTGMAGPSAPPVVGPRSRTALAYSDQLQAVDQPLSVQQTVRLHEEAATSTTPERAQELAARSIVSGVVANLADLNTKAESAEIVGQASSPPVPGASLPRQSGGRMPSEPADKLSAPQHLEGALAFGGTSAVRSSPAPVISAIANQTPFTPRESQESRPRGEQAPPDRSNVYRMDPKLMERYGLIRPGMLRSSEASPEEGAKKLSKAGISGPVSQAGTAEGRTVEEILRDQFEPQAQAAAPAAAEGAVRRSLQQTIALPELQKETEQPRVETVVINAPPAAEAKPDARTLVQDGRLLIETGKLDDAEAKLKQAAAMEPSNQAAGYYLDLVQQVRKEGESRQREIAASSARKPALDTPAPSPRSQTGAIRQNLRELESLVSAREALSLRANSEKVDAALPKSTAVEIVDRAEAQRERSATLLERIRATVTGTAGRTARIEVGKEPTEVAPLLMRVEGLAIHDPHFIETEFEKIKSRRVLGKVIEKLNLDEAWAKKRGSSGKLGIAETYKILAENVEVSKVPKTSLVDIKVKSDNPDEAARIANTIAEVYRDERLEQSKKASGESVRVLQQQLDENEKKIAQAKEELERMQKEAKASQAESSPPKPAANAPVPQPEVQTKDNSFSTFSLNVSDVSFKLAAASLEKGAMPDPATVRSEEFINAFDYRDSEPPPGVPVAFAWDRARYPFAHNRDLLRFSIKTAAQGRQSGRPMNLVLLLDNSGSMERADRVRIVREALRVLAGELKPQDKLSVIAFARTARLWADGVPGHQAGQVAEQAGGLTPQGGTNFEGAMNLAYQTALRHYLAGGINRVVLLTDGAANLGNVDPNALKQKVETHRKQGIALDCFGIGWEGYNDDLLEVLSRNGDGRYGFINTPEEAASGFAAQLAGALRVAASDVKVQVEFNPNRVTAYRQIGYAKHQLTKEQFRDNTVDAAEIGAAESGNALYVVEVNPRGEGPLAVVRVRYKLPGTGLYREHEWPVPYTGNAMALEQSSPAIRLACTASAFSEWLVSNPYAGEVTPDRLLAHLGGVPEVFGADPRPKKLEWMIRQAKSIAGR